MSSQHSDHSFRITTTRVAATVTLTRGEPLSGAFSCAGAASRSAGSAELVALLNQAAGFVPFFPSDRHRPVLLGKHAIRLVEVDAEQHLTLPDEFGEVRSLELLLDDGTELRGGIRISAPLGHTRTLDNLNEAGRFIVLRNDQRVLLVNLASVVLAADLG